MPAHLHLRAVFLLALLGLAGVGATLAESAETRPGLVAKMWWNQPKKVAELGLEPAQRRSMDALAEAFLAKRKRSIEDQKAAYAALGEALATGDPEAVAARAAAAKKAVAAAPSAQIDLMVGVVALLSEEQKRRLVDRYPKILSRQWIRSGRRPGR